MYPDFKKFQCDELRRHIGIALLHRISPLPQIQMKFKGQADDFANGNDFVQANLGPNAER